MMMRASIVALLLAAPGVMGPAVLHGAIGADPVVETLALDTELESRGRLGGVAVDTAGFVYVSNFADAVWRISPDGSVETLARGLQGASGIAIDVNGDILQAGFADHTIRRISSEGEVTTLVDHGLAAPVGLAVDPAGNVFVCNCGNNTIARASRDGAVETFGSGPLFACPNGITFDDRGDLYVVNFNNDYLVRLSPAGEASVLATLPPDGSGNAHVAFAAGDLFVTKITTNEIVRVTREGDARRFAGTGELGLRDGPVLSATLARPNGIATGPDGMTLWFNNLDGEWRGSEKTTIVLRSIRLGDGIRSILVASWPRPVTPADDAP